MKTSGQQKRRERTPLFYLLTGTLFGAGYIPIAPATAASIITCAVVWFLLKTPYAHLLSLIVLFIPSIWISSKLETYWGKDNRRIVIDESIGMLITLLVVPHKILFFLIAFLLFRFFDIVKPYPINQSQELKGGWGVVIDDVIAGMFASIVLWLFIFFYYSIA